MTVHEQAAAYEAVSYPTGVFPRTHPDRLAVVARLHGLTPPPIETARVLEIAGGDGMNLICLAGSFPRAQFLSFDVAPSAVARGRAWVREAGFDNVRVELIDLLDAAATLDGPFDYIIAHGLYAWVPPAVAVAAMRLVGQMLSPDGVAMISYNVLPGGHLRLALREMLLDALRDVDAPQERMATAKAILVDYGEPRDKDLPFVAALREEARSLAKRQPEVLWHDELNPCYAPQTIGAFARAAHDAGLQYLGESDASAVEHGFLPDAATDRSTGAAVHALQALDYATGRLFRHSLLVRGERVPQRRLTSEPIADLHVAIEATRTGPLAFSRGKAGFEVDDVALADRIAALAERWPRSVAVRDHFAGKVELDLLFRLYQGGLALLSTVPVQRRFATSAGERPVSSPLARAVLRSGGNSVPTLDYRTIWLGEPGPRAFVQLLDGTRDRATLAADWAAHPDTDGVEIDTALRTFAGFALLAA